MVYIYSASRLNYLVARAFVDLPYIGFTLVPKSSLVSYHPMHLRRSAAIRRVRTASVWIYEKLKRLPTLFRARA